MNDMFATAPIPIAAQIACVEREIAMRHRVYPRWVAAGKLTQAKADAEIAAMTAVRESLSDRGALALQGRNGVLVSLLTECWRVIGTIEGDDDEEREQLRALCIRVSTAINTIVAAEAG